MALTHVLTPLRINGCELKNRVVRTAHGTNLGLGTISDDLIEYHYARGRGGVGLSIIEILSIHTTTPFTLNIFSPDLDKKYGKMVERIRPTGMKLFQQLWHGGHNAAPLDGGPPWSASDAAGLLVNIPAIPMTKMMIDEIVDAYAQAARSCEAWGLDGVEVHAAHGYLPAQFLAPAINKREDEYGGPFENRVRFLKEVMVAVRGAVSPTFPVGIRIAPDMMVGGVGVEESLRAMRLMEELGLIDYANVSMGNYQTFPKMIGGMHEPMGYELETGVPITRGLGVPSIVTGRFRTLEEADNVIRSGDAALVSFVRALIADPNLVNKSAEGRAEQVRPCIGCNQGCLARIAGPPYRLGCTVNPAVGYEAALSEELLKPAEAPKRILVVGGGPAGMEAARVAALRGHRVTLAEATRSLGGAILDAAKAPTRNDIADITVWLEQEVYRLGVDVRLSTFMDVDDIDASDWDSVIVATGSVPRLDGVQNSNPGEAIKGMDLPHVLSSIDLIRKAPSDFGRCAVVLDDAGYYEGLACAEYLANAGVAVNFVTRHISIAPHVELAQMVEPALQRLAQRDFTAHLRSRAIAIDGRTVTVAPTYLPSTTNRSISLTADTVVVVSLNRANRELHDSLVRKGLPSRAIGDANAARQLQDAIREGRMAGMEV